MIIDVSKNKLSLIEGNLIHTGEYKVNEIVFNLSEEYTETTNKAIFTNCSGSYEVPIIDGKCDIPPGVLNEEEIITIGVYGYTIQNNRYVVRYSPAPINVKINEGSYVVGADNGEIITPTQFEIYTQAMDEGLKEVEGTIAYLQEVAEEVNSKGNEAEEQGLFAQQTAEEIQKKANEGDFAGATFIPQVDEEGNISWENDRGLENPEPRNIRGVDGKEGQPGKNATINGLEAINIVGGDNIDLVQQGNDLYINYNGTQMNVEVVENLPATGISGRIYLVLKETGADSDIYDEYLYINDVWEHIGSTAIDLSNYYTKEEIDEKIDNIEVPIPTASSDILGGIKVGETLNIGEDGTLNINNLNVYYRHYPNEDFDYVNTPDSDVGYDILPTDPDGLYVCTGKNHSVGLIIHLSTIQYLICPYGSTGLYLFTRKYFTASRPWQSWDMKGSLSVRDTVHAGDTTGNYYKQAREAVNSMAVTNYVGKLADLTTATKTNIVNAINEVKEIADNAGGDLPIASADVLGGIKVGENLEITEDGTLNAKDYFPTETGEVALADLPLGLHYAPTGSIRYKKGGSVFDSNTSTPRIIMKNTDNTAVMFSVGPNSLTIKNATSISGGSRNDNYISYKPTDNLTSTNATTSLSANQGRVLNEKIIALQESMGNISTILATLTTVEEVSE